MSENKNQDVVVALFGDAQTGNQAVERLKSWDKANDDVKLGAVGVLSMKDGKIETQVGHKTGKGVAVGAVTGLVAGVLTGGIGLVAAVLGGGIGGVVGAFSKKSINLTEQEIESLGKELETGKVAVVVACDDFEIEPTAALLKEAGGEVTVYSVSSEAMDQAQLDENDRLIEKDPTIGMIGPALAQKGMRG